MHLRLGFMNRALLREELRKESLRRRELRDLSNPLNIPATLFIANYRLSQDVFTALCEELRPMIPVRRRITGVPLELKVLTTLSFLATGSYQKVVGNDFHSSLSQKSVSRHMNEIVSALNEIMDRHIKFPATQEERNSVKQGFYEKYQFPDVIGCIDGTHIAIIKPKVHEEAFFNQKGFHSMNALMICDSNLKIIAICARYGGASHDAHVWQMMAIKPPLEEANNRETFWLLGDSAFPLRPYMMTPILNAVPGSPEENYTKMQSRVRNCIERCFGILKARWRCLLKPSVLHYTPEVAVKLSNACAVLHNIAIEAHMPEPEDFIIEDDFKEVVNIDDQPNDLLRGQITQRQLVETLNH